MIWFGVHPAAFATDTCGGKFANWVIISGESVPVGVEMKSNVGVVRKTDAGRMGITKVAMENSIQNKMITKIEREADRLRRRVEN